MLFRHPLIGGPTCPLDGVPNLSQSVTVGWGAGQALDHINMVWLSSVYAALNSSIQFGTVDSATGAMTLLGESATFIPDSQTTSPGNTAVDPGLSMYFVCTGLDTSLLYYGTYNTSTGEPTTTGSYISLGQSVGNRNTGPVLALDTTRKLWWAAYSASGQEFLAYGTYASGVPVLTGVSAVAYPLSLGCDAENATLWALTNAGTLGTLTYNTTTGEPGAWTTLQTGLGTSFVDRGGSIAIDPAVGRALVGVTAAINVYTLGGVLVGTVAADALSYLALDAEHKIVAAAKSPNEIIYSGLYC